MSFFSQTLFSQTFSFRNYGAERNIPNLFTYTINQTDDGYLWVGMGNGIARFDGFEFFMAAFPDSVNGRYPTSSFKDRAGTLWYGCSDGTVFYVRNRKLVQVDIENTSSVNKVIQSSDGKIFIIPQSRAIFSINASNPAEIFRYDHDISSVIFSACFTPQGELLLGTQENLIISRFEENSINILNVVDGFDYSAVTSIISVPGSQSEYLIGTDGSGLFLLTVDNSSHDLKRIKGLENDEYLYIQSLFVDNDNTIWISTFGDGAIRFKLSQDHETAQSITYNLSTGLNSNDIKLIFQDLEGNYWFGTFGNGISMLSSYASSSFIVGRNNRENNIIYVNSFEDKYILGTPAGFHLFDSYIGKSESFTDLLRYTDNVNITSYFKDSDGNIWFGTAGSGLYVMNAEGKVTLFYRSWDTGLDNIRDIKIDDRNIWLATINGLIALDKFTGELFKRFDISNGLPHSSINTVFIDRDGNIIVGSNEGERLFYIDRNYAIRSTEGTMTGGSINRIQSVSQGYYGVVWIATRGNGVFRLTADTVKTAYRTVEFVSNYCYSILSDSDQNIWVGHDIGFSRYNPIAGTIKTFETGFSRGGVCNMGAIFETDDGKILIGTTEGLIIYDKKRDNLSQMPPMTNLNYIAINDKPYDYQPVYTLPYRSYFIRLNFVGIHFSDPEKVSYSVLVENFDNDWSNFSSNREIPYNLRDGRYKFNIISVNSEGIAQDEPFSFVIIIKKPWWRTNVAIMIWGLLVTGAVILIIKYRERSQKQLQKYLEAELDARTSIIRKQKEEIELQNIEITDSINYAKRIQTSILPDYNKLKEIFSDAFVIFRPRNIVSGDFYWFDWLDKDKFILVCADSTGHGVPGAFMSMIGTTLLRDIVTRQKVSKPSQILSLLDKQVFSTLNQNMKLGITGDGMDMVVCEFNLKRRHLRFASAMRPAIIIIGGESFYIKGNRASVGGESIMEKYFDDQEYYLNEGDTIYLFSDGLSDQFGGIDGKKMKISRLKKLIEQVSDLPMEEQQSVISSFYDEWKGTCEQVDDILLIGIRM